MNARTRNILQVATAIVVVGAAGLAAVLLTRNDAPAAPGMDGHDHSAMAPAAEVASPVMLSAEAARRIGVTYATAERGSLGGEVRAVGLVSYDETRLKAVSPKIDGWIEELFVAYTGQPVEAGAPLFRIYSPMLVTAQEELLLARRLVDQLNAARAGTEQGAPPRQAASQAVTQAMTMLESARRRLRYWDVAEDDIARIERSGDVQRTITLRSPVRGIVLRKDLLSGQRVMAGDAVYQVADLSEVWIDGEVFEQDLGSVRLGQSVRAEFDALPGESRAGRVIFVSPTVAPDTRTVQVRIVVANPGLRLKPGMFATIRVSGAALPSSVHVPRSALLSTGTRSLVFVRSADGHLVPRPVEAGPAIGDRVTIRRGLEAGEVVVASATFLVDAESNLSAALAGMAGMPGMTTPASEPSPPSKPSDMPGMPGMKTPPQP